MSETMRGIVFQGEGRWALEACPMPALAADDDVLLKIDSASICGTDLHILSVPPGHPATPGSILGHEYVATVEQIGSAANGLASGDRVVIDPNLACGLCRSCRTGKTNCCENMTTLGIFRNGGLAEFNVAPAKALHKINRDVPIEQAALAEPLTCVLHAFEKVAITPGESVVVIGGGPIGQLFSMLYKSAGAGMTIVIEPIDYRRRVAEICGADTVLDPAAVDSTAAIRSATAGGASVVIDAAGRFFQQALDIVRPGGRVILFGMDQRAECRVKQFDIARSEMTIFGSFIQNTAFPKVVKILESGILPIEKLVTHQFGLEEFGSAIELLRQGQAVKTVLSP